MSPSESSMYTYLGRSALEISRLAIGTVNIGGRVNEPEAHAMFDHAFDCGLNFIDTANMYGWRVYKGYTEEVIGRWLANCPGRRGDIVLATKVGNPVGDGPNQRGLSSRHIVASCEASLRRLGTEWIDLFQMHTADPHASWDEIWEAMDQLVAQGKVRYVGSSNFAGWRIAAAQAVARHRHSLGIISEQCLYNLTARQVEAEVIPAAMAHGVGVLVWAPLHGGLLSGAIEKMASGTAVKSAQGRAAAALPQWHDAIAGYERTCAELGRSPAEVGMAWAASRPGVTALVIGPRTPAHVDGAIAALETPLACDELARVEAHFQAAVTPSHVKAPLKQPPPANGHEHGTSPRAGSAGRPAESRHRDRGRGSSPR